MDFDAVDDFVARLLRSKRYDDARDVVMRSRLSRKDRKDFLSTIDACEAAKRERRQLQLQGLINAKTRITTLLESPMAASSSHANKWRKKLRIYDKDIQLLSLS